MNKIIITLLFLYPCCTSADTLTTASIQGEVTSKTRVIIDKIDGQFVNSASSVTLKPGSHQLQAYLLKTSGSMDSDKLVAVDLQWTARSGQRYQVQMEKHSQHMDGRVIDHQGLIVSQHGAQEILPLTVNVFLGAKA